MGDPRPVYKYLDVIFYVGAYLALAFTPSKWSAFQTGFCAGYAISMCPAIVLITILGGMGFPSGPAPAHSHLVSAVICNMILAIIALMSWYLQRDTIKHRWAKVSLGVGLVYPFAAFFAVAILAVPFP
jgi:hypothetical protein